MKNKTKLPLMIILIFSAVANLSYLAYLVYSLVVFSMRLTAVPQIFFFISLGVLAVDIFIIAFCFVYEKLGKANRLKVKLKSKKVVNNKDYKRKNGKK